MFHEPVLLHESIDALNIDPAGVYFDVTFGGGGHSAEILKRLSKKGRLFSIDQDSDAHKNKIQDSRFKLIFGNFRYIINYVDYYQLEKIDGIIADFGVSSYQFDKQERGFSFRLGGDLDMRMNAHQTNKASDILNSYSEEDIFNVFKSYSDIKNPGHLTKIILQSRASNDFGSIEEFINAIKPAIPARKEIKYLAQVFQALRIEVNDEINALNEFLDSTVLILKTGGRLSCISYHSLEDRPVKNLIKKGNTKGELIKDAFGNMYHPFKAVNKKVITPTDEEINSNPRAKSAKLRIAERI